MGIIQAIFLFLRAFILGRAATAIENLALRQQVAVFKQSAKYPLETCATSLRQICPTMGNLSLLCPYVGRSQGVHRLPKT
jgi:hypothetical protein